MDDDLETVQWIAVTTTDENDLGDGTETAADPVPLSALVAARSAEERTNNDTPAVITGLTIYLLGTDVVPGASDRFVVRGEVCEVEGKAHRWSGMGVEVSVKRTGRRP